MTFTTRLTNTLFKLNKPCVTLKCDNLLVRCTPKLVLLRCPLHCLSPTHDCASRDLESDGRALVCVITQFNCVVKIVSGNITPITAVGAVAAVQSSIATVAEQDGSKDLVYAIAPGTSMPVAV